MRQVSLLMVLSVVLLVSACTSGTGNKKEVNLDERPAAPEYLSINPAESRVDWIISDADGKHLFNLEVLRGMMKIVEGELKGGQVFLDMQSLKNEDMKDGIKKSKLTNLLKTRYLFAAKSYPQAMIEIVKAEPLEDASKSMEGIVPTHRINGKLTLKGVTKNIQFDARIDMQSNLIEIVSSGFHFNRMNWKIKYKAQKQDSGEDDDYIGNEIGIKLNLKATK